MNANDIKILVITVPSWNSKVGANSWELLLKEHPADHVASIYIRDEIPNSNICARYFNISENRIIKSIFNRKVKTGREIQAQLTDGEADEDLQAHNKRYIKMKKRRRHSMLLARELVWRIGRWKTPELDAFLDSFQPDVVLHSMEGYIHLNRITEYAIKRTGAKAIGYIWDDNFTYKQSAALGYKVYRYFQRDSLKKLARCTNAFFAISPFTKKEADDFFGIHCKVLTKPLSSSPVAHKISGQYPLKMLYTGNLFIGRDRSLLRVCRALAEINCRQTYIELDVYTQTVLSEKMRASIENQFCHIHGPISQEEALQKQKETDILLFLEDIDGKDAKAARLSFSTKITDYLSAGKCIFAVGNRDTAPMQYFAENQAAVVCGSEGEILARLKQICMTPALVDSYAQKAYLAAQKNHDPAKVHQCFDETIRQAVQA